MAILPIRIFGDPVLRQRAREIDDVNGALVRLAEDMIETMYDAPGVGLAANQVGVERRMFVYDIGDGPGVVLNPVISEARGEWTYDEGCLSIPDLSWPIVRPKELRLRGVSLDGEELDIEADELLARCFQHEIDHLDGVLVVERLDADQRKDAMRVIRSRVLDSRGTPHVGPPIRLAFLGTPTLAASSLREIVAAGHEVVAVVSRADRRRGRGGSISPSPVKAAALELGLPVSADLDDVVRSGAQLAIVLAFGRLIPPRLLDQVDFVNLHLSLLPRWRGAAPVERAILAGDEVTGVSLMALDAGLDTGPVYGAIGTTLGDDITADELGEQLVALGTADLVARLRAGLAGLGEPQPQVGDAVYADKLGPSDRAIDFTAQTAVQCHRVVRVGRASTSFRGARLLVHRAEEVEGFFGEPGTLVGDVVATGKGGLRLLVVQAAGRRALPFADFAGGARPLPGERLGDARPPAAAR